MPENINWSAVIQSITDFWLPIIGCVFAIIGVIVIVNIIKKLKNDKKKYKKYSDKDNKMV